MLSEAELRGAVADGIISAEQAQKLLALAGQPVEGVYDRLDPRDEPFRLLRGFRDVFIAIGLFASAFGATILIWDSVSLPPFAFGAWNVGGIILLGESDLDLLFFAIPLGLGFAAANYITLRSRLPLSSLVLACFVGYWAAFLMLPALGFVLSSAGLFPSLPTASLFYALSPGAAVGLALFYWRYRLPFALLPLAGSLVFLMIFVLGLFMPEVVGSNMRTIVGGLGVAISAVALWFDFRDPERVTRFSECGFWLHLLAAPLLVHAALGKLATDIATGYLAALIAVLALVALVIDRRALLVSALSYMAVAIFGLLASSKLSPDYQLGLTALLLGLIVLVLGIGWTALRFQLIRLLPFPALISRLPPALPATGLQDHRV